MKKWIAVLLVVALCAFGGCGKEPEAPAKKEFTPVLRFVVASDVHIADEDSLQEEQRLEKLFQVSYDYSKQHSTYSNLDGVFIAGDFTNRGTPSSMEKFFSIVEDNLQKGTTFRVALGNHEYYNDAENTVRDFLAASGYESEDAHLTVNGYHFLLLSPDKGGKGYSQQKQDWLARELKAAAEDDPAGKKPIFVFQHHHISGTVYGSESWGLPELKPVLDPYPQVIDFSGHSHFPITDPTSMWQGEFTALGTGTLSYYEMGLAGVDPDYIFPTDDAGGYAEQKSGVRDAAQFYIVEVDGENRVKIQGYDLLSDSFMIEPYEIPSVGNPEEFVYTSARAETSQAPVFPETAAVTAAYEAGSVKLQFPQATCRDNTQHYRCELYKDGERVQTQYRLSCTFMKPTPETLSVTFENLEKDGAYSVKIYAVNSWAKESAPLIAELK